VKADLPLSELLEFCKRVLTNNGYTVSGTVPNAETEAAG
jgi:hypothetical protein